MSDAGAAKAEQQCPVSAGCAMAWPLKQRANLILRPRMRCGLGSEARARSLAIGRCDNVIGFE